MNNSKRDTVIRDFERFVQEYSVEFTNHNEEMLRDVVCLLKKQEPIKSSIGGSADTCWWHTCGECHEQIDKGDKYCRWCGRMIEWK